MKLIVALLIAFIALPALAQVERGLTCYSWGNTKTLGIVFEGGRYADWITFDDDTNQVLRPLFHQDEQTLKINNSSLNITLSMGQCKRGTGDTLVTCTYQGQGFAMSGYHFEFFHPDSAFPRFGETVDLQRRIELSHLELSVKHVPTIDSLTKKPTEMAVLTVKMDATTNEGLKHVEFSQRVGEWTSATNRSNSDRCQFDDETPANL